MEDIQTNFFVASIPVNLIILYMKFDSQLQFTVSHQHLASLKQKLPLFSAPLSDRLYFLFVVILKHFSIQKKRKCDMPFS